MKTKKIKQVVLFSREQTKEYLQITQPTLRKWTQAGMLKAYSLGGRIYYKLHEILEALEEVKPYNQTPHG